MNRNSIATNRRNTVGQVAWYKRRRGYGWRWKPATLVCLAGF